MEIERDVLIKLLEAFVDGTTELQRELMLYQLLFQGACQAERLTPHQMELVLARARETQGPRIREATDAIHKTLLANIPAIVDLLADDQAKGLKSFREWIPRGKPN